MFNDFKSAFPRKGFNFLNGIFIGMFRLNPFSVYEMEFLIQLFDPDRLIPRTIKIAFHGSCPPIETSLLNKKFRIEIGPELLVDAFQQVKVEFFKNSLGIVVRLVEGLGMLQKVEANEGEILRIERVPQRTQKYFRPGQVVISNRGT